MKSLAKSQHPDMQEEENLKVTEIHSLEALNIVDGRYCADCMRDIWGWAFNLYYLFGLKNKNQVDNLE